MDSLDGSKADRFKFGLERACGQPGADLMVDDRSNIVWGVGMKEGGQILNLPATGPELELAAAIGADSFVGEMVVGVEQCFQPAKAGRLDVDHHRLACERGDVGDRANRGIPRHSAPRGTKKRSGYQPPGSKIPVMTRA